MAEQPRVNKTAFVKNVLNEIGALGSNPPEGWRKQVEEALKKQNLEMHTVTIYQIRRNALLEAAGIKGKPKSNKANKESKTRGRPKAAMKEKVQKSSKVKSRSDHTLTLEDVIALQKFSEKFGGINALANFIGRVQGITQSLK